MSLDPHCIWRNAIDNRRRQTGHLHWAKANVKTNFFPSPLPLLIVNIKGLPASSVNISGQCWSMVTWWRLKISSRPIPKHHNLFQWKWPLHSVWVTLKWDSLWTNMEAMSLSLSFQYKRILMVRNGQILELQRNCFQLRFWCNWLRIQTNCLLSIHSVSTMWQ